MADENRTEYVNGERNTEQEEPVLSGIDRLRTEYVGKPSSQSSNTVNQTEYVGLDTDTKPEVDDSQTEYVGKPVSNRGDDLQSDANGESSIITPKPADAKIANESIEEPVKEFDRSAPEIASRDSGVNGGNELTEESVSYYLPTNTMLQKRYRINSVIGEGGFGITYSGWDITLNTPVAIKEYYPSGLVTRSATLGKTTQVVPLSQAKYGNQFRDGIDRVLDEARRTAKFRNTPGIVGIYDFFEANNTAYIVLEYVDGVTLDVYCKNNRVDNTTLFNMLVPVMDALQALHNEGIIHRDISPDNIMVDKDGNFKLLDFGAARGFSEESSTTMSIILKKSYAPEEQFRSKGNQGPWTDVYALGASIYELIAGQTPPSSIDRLAEDEIVDIRKIAPALTKAQAQAIMKALSVKAKDRWQTIEEFKQNLLLDSSVQSLKSVNNPNVEVTENNKQFISFIHDRKALFTAIGLMAVVVLILVIVVSRLSGTKGKDTNSNNTVSSEPLMSTNDEMTSSTNTSDEQENQIELDEEPQKSDADKHPGYVGVYTSSIPEEIIVDYDIKEGCYISGVSGGTPAKKGNMKEGDIIIAVDEYTVSSNSDFSLALRNYYAGDEVTLHFLRLEGNTYVDKSQSIVLADRHDYYDEGTAYMGVNDSDIPADIKEKYSISEGVYLTTVGKDGPSDESGLIEGDIIIFLDNHRISNDEEFSNVLSTYYAGDRIKVKYLHFENDSYKEHETVVYTGNKEDQELLAAVADDIRAQINASSNKEEAEDNSKTYSDNSVSAHLDAVSHSSTSYYAYISFTNNTNEELEIHTKDVYINGYPLDSGGTRNIGSVPANKTVILSNHINVDILIAKGITEVDSFSLVYCINDDKTQKRIDEENLSISIDYLPEDLGKTSGNDHKSIEGTFDRENVPVTIEYTGYEYNSSNKKVVLYYMVENASDQKVYLRTGEKYINGAKVKVWMSDFTPDIAPGKSIQTTIEYKVSELTQARIDYMDLMEMEIYFLPDGNKLSESERDYIWVTFKGMDVPINDLE